MVNSISQKMKIISFSAESELHSRLRRIAECESARCGFPVTVSAIIRRGLDIGLEIIEKRDLKQSVLDS